MSSRSLCFLLIIVLLVGCEKDGSAPTQTPISGTIGGKVIDSLTGAGIAGALITTYPATKNVSSDSSGKYKLTEISPAKYTLITVRDGYIPDSIEVEVIGGRETTANISLTSTASRLPAIPVLHMPFNREADVVLPVKLTWLSSRAALSYSLQVAVDSLFTFIIHNENGITDTLRQISSLENRKTYYWRVMAVNNHGASDYSEKYVFTTIGTAPSAPVLFSPANNAVDVPLSPTLTWNAVSEAESYTLQLSKTISFDTVVYNQSGLADTSITLNGLENLTTYYWRVNAANRYGLSPYSLVRSFTTVGSPPSAPVLLLPANGATGVPIAPLLSWNLSAGASGYTLQVSYNSSFTDLIYNQSGLTVTSHQISGLSNSTTYYWRVNATNNYGTSSYSSVRSFITVAGGIAPTAPTLTSPNNGATNVAIPPTLSWNASTGATSYTLQVSTSNSFSYYVYNQSGLTGINQQVSGLSNSTTYYWRVSASNSYGTSDFSDIRSFTTVVGGTAPTVPILSSPGNGASSVGVPATLSWYKSPGAISYSLQISTSSSFSNFVHNSWGYSDTVKQINELNSSTTYYWRVRAVNDFGASTYSTVWSFSTSAGAPPAPILTSPVNGATGVALPIEFKWNASAGAASYTLQISTSNSFSSFFYNKSGLTNTIELVSGFSASTKYFWRLSATNTYGTSPFSNPSNFTTSSPGGGVPCPGIPNITYEGKIYNTVQIGSQCWLKENLDAGTMIPGNVSSSNNGTLEKYCINNEPSYCNAYGAMYSWDEAMAYSTVPGSRGICPDGWHIPTIQEFQILINSVNNDGNRLKAIGQGSGVFGVGTNTSGFTAFLTGMYYPPMAPYFFNFGDEGLFWSSNQNTSTLYEAKPLKLEKFYSWISIIDRDKDWGFQVRCVKD